MFLVRREEKIRLMSFKTNPWLDLKEEDSGKDPDVVKQSIYLFSGDVRFKPTEWPDGSKIDQKTLSLQRVNRRFNNDRVQNV